MPAPESHDNLAAVWPPAITLSSSIPPDHRPRKTARLAKASLWAAGAGVACWVGTYAFIMVLEVIYQNRPNMPDVDPLVHTAYFAGLACEVAGISLGLFGRNTKTGKVGLFLSLVILSAMVVFTLTIHQGYMDGSGHGGWIWDKNEGDNGNCGCDNRL